MGGTQSATQLPSKISASFVLKETSGLLQLKFQERIINIQADREFSAFIDNKEWNCYGQTYFNKLQKYGLVETPIDLFVPRLNAKVSCYASWRLNPGTTYVDVFPITWETIFLCCSPFSFIAHCLHKIVRVEAEGIVIVPFYGLPSHVLTAVTSDRRCAKDISIPTNHAQNTRKKCINFLH